MCTEEGKTTIALSQRGATLIIIIISMVGIAVLGAGLYTMTFTASLNQAQAQKAAKAHYLSESCIRIAASEYKAAANKNSTLANLHGKKFIMPNNQGDCKVEVYPYWFYAPTITDSNLQVYYPGGVPPDYPNSFPNVAGKQKLINTNGTEYDFTDMKVNSDEETFTPNVGTRVTFTVPSGSNVQAGSEMFLGYEFSSAAVNSDGDLELTLPHNALSKIFPPERGIIFLNESCDGNNLPYIFSYDSLETETGKVSLTKIKYIGSCSPEPTPFDAGGEKIVYIGKNIGFRSTSEFGD